MVGYWPIFFPLASLSIVKVNKNARKEQGQHRAILTERTWSIFLRGQRGKSRGDIPERFVLPTWVANQNAGFVSSFPLAEAAI